MLKTVPYYSTSNEGVPETCRDPALTPRAVLWLVYRLASPAHCKLCATLYPITDAVYQPIAILPKARVNLHFSAFIVIQKMMSLKLS